MFFKSFKISIYPRRRLIGEDVALNSTSAEIGGVTEGVSLGGGGMYEGVSLISGGIPDSAIPWPSLNATKFALTIFFLLNPL